MSLVSKFSTGVTIHRIHWAPFGVYQPYIPRASDPELAYEHLKAKLAEPLAILLQATENKEQCMLVESRGTNASLLVAAAFFMSHYHVTLQQFLNPLVLEKSSSYYARNGTASHIYDFVLWEMNTLSRSTMSVDKLKALFGV